MQVIGTSRTPAAYPGHPFLLLNLDLVDPVSIHGFVDEARKRHSAKRGGGAIQVSLVEATNVAQEQAANVVALDDALKTLESIDGRQSEIVECVSSEA